MEFIEESVLPGTNATILIRSEPGSYCSIGVVDKSIELLLNNDQLTPEKVQLKYYRNFKSVFLNVKKKSQL